MDFKIESIIRKARKYRRILQFLLKVFPDSKNIKDLIIINKQIVDTYNLRSKSKRRLFDFEAFGEKMDKTSKLFIIGSGSSLNNLTESDWKFINSNITFSYNYAILQNQCLPKLHFIESSDEMEYQKIYYDAISLKKEESFDIIFNDLHFTAKTLNPPGNIKNRTYFQIPITIPTSNKKLFKFILKFGKYFLPFENPNFTIHHGASLSNLLNLGMKLGFAEIIILGVDLIDTEYFFYSQDDELSKLLTKKYKIHFKDEKVHRTGNKELMNDWNRLPITEYIEVINQIKKSKVKLYIGSDKSLLAKYLPVYNWEKINN